MANLSQYLRQALYNHALGKSSFTMPATVTVALYTSDPTVNDTGTEVTGGSYARQTLVMDAPVTGGGSNTSAITFTNMPACVVTHVGIRDASTGGNLLIFGALAASRTVTAGANFTIAAGNLTITFA